MLREPHISRLGWGLAALTAGLWFHAGASWAGDDASPKIPHRSARLTVDGDLSDWNEGAAELDLQPSSHPSPTGSSPRARLTWDREALYLGFEVADDDLVALAPEDGTHDPFAVDRVEIRVDVDGDGGAMGQDDVRVLLGCDGSLSVYRGSEPSADGRTVFAGVGPVAGLGASVQRRTDGYTAELAVPAPLLDRTAYSSGEGVQLAVVVTDVSGRQGDRLGQAAATWRSGGPGTDAWTPLALVGGPRWVDRLSGGASAWLLALVAALLAAAGTATVFLLRQRAARARFDALADRLAEIERTSSPSIEVVIADEPSGAGASLTVAPPATASLSLTASASLVTVLRTGFTVLPFEQAAKDLASRIRELEEKGEDAVGATEWQALAEMALAYLKLHVADNLSVTELAGALHMTSRTLQRGIRRALDCTPRELILAVKMTEAKRLLKTGVHRVSEVGYQVGFEDPGHFSRRFKAYYGCTPSAMVAQYRDAVARETSR